MKYRILNNDELVHFQEDFKHFLIINGVSNEAWELMNKKAPEKARELVGLFSDSVLQKVYEKITFLEFRSPDSCIVFKLSGAEIEMLSVVRKNETVNLSEVESIHDAFINNPKALSYFKTSKKYSKNREAEIHQMIESGCVLSSEEFWDSLIKVID